MHPSEFYQSILMQINDELERHVFEVLSAHVGEAVTRLDLLIALYGPNVARGDLASNPHDRAIRTCIERLREKDFPIVSTSGESGYILTDQPELIDRCVAEERSRIQHTEIKITHLLKSKTLAHSLHQWRQGIQLPVQPSLF